MLSASYGIANQDNGALDQIDPWAHVHRIVAQSGTSFLWGMKVLPAKRRRAMYAIYAFCREVDDIADEPGEISNKRKALAAWRKEIDQLYAGQPRWPTTKALLPAVQQFGLPKEEFLAVVDGMEIDAAPEIQMQKMEDLSDYCRKVAGAVGVLSIHAFGASQEPGPRIAELCGKALQLTNILRDLKQDAELKRLYIPLEILHKHGVTAPSPTAMFTHPGFAEACKELAGLAHHYYSEADGLIRKVGRRKMRPAVIMMAVYREMLARLEKRGWSRIDDLIQMTGPQKMWVALRRGFF